MNRLLGVAFVVLLVGCASQTWWVRDDGRPSDQAAFDRDQYPCQLEARQARAYSSGGYFVNGVWIPATMHAGSEINVDLFHLCLRSKGWRQVESPPSR
jgi:hypothetical protein